MNDRCRRLFESVLPIRTYRYRATSCRCPAPAPTALVTGNVQFFTAITRIRAAPAFLFVLVLGTPLTSILLSLFYACFFLGGGGSGLFFRLARLDLSLFLGLDLATLIFFGSPKRFFFLFFFTLLRLFRSVNLVLFFLSLAIQLILLFLRLLLEHIAFHVSAFTPNLDIHGTRAALGPRQPELGA